MTATRLIRLAAAVFVVSSFGAMNAEAKVALLGPSGAKAKALRVDLTALLSERDEVVAEELFAPGQRRPSKSKALEAWIAARAEAAGVSAVVVAELRGREAHLAVHVPGRPTARQRFALDKRSTFTPASRAQAAEWLLGQLEDLEAAGEVDGDLTQATGDEPGEARVASRRSRATGGAAGEAVIERSPPSSSRGLLGLTPEGMPPLAFITLELGGLSRGLGYNDAITPNLRPYKAYFLPTIGARIELFPLATTGAAGPAEIGVFFGIARSFGASAREVGPSYPTTHSAVSLGVEYLADLGAVVLVPALSFENRSFTLDPADDGTEETELPDVSYSGVQAALGLELSVVDGVVLLAGGGFTRVMSTGEIISTRYHRGGRANAVAANAGVRLEITPELDLQLGVRYQHYFFAFAPRPGDRFVAGGALDQYVSAAASLRIAL